MLTRSLLIRGSRPLLNSVVCKALFGSTPDTRDPLALMRNECHKRKLCDEHGFRRPGAHWVFSVAVTPDDLSQPPSLRTVGIQRVSPEGIDFVMKKGSSTCDAMAAGRPIAILQTHGRHMPGEQAEQWRGEGHCKRIPLDDLVIVLPQYTTASMLSSRRMEKENQDILDKDSPGDRLAIQNRSRATEIVQKTRRDLEKGDITMSEMNDAIRAFRFYPNRLECMVGGPDSIQFERWEWAKDDPFSEWQEARPLLAH